MSAGLLFFFLFMVGVSALTIRYLLSQVKDKELLDSDPRNSAPGIVPGNIQISNPAQKPFAPEKFIPTGEVHQESLSQKEAENEAKTSEKPQVSKKPSSKSKRMRLFEDKQDIRRSIIIDEILNRKTK